MEKIMKIKEAKAYGEDNFGSIQGGIGIRFDNNDHYAFEVTSGMCAEKLAAQLMLCAMQIVACAKLEEDGIKASAQHAIH